MSSLVPSGDQRTRESSDVLAGSATGTVRRSVPLGLIVLIGVLNSPRTSRPFWPGNAAWAGTASHATSRMERSAARRTRNMVAMVHRYPARFHELFYAIALRECADRSGRLALAQLDAADLAGQRLG